LDEDARPAAVEEYIELAAKYTKEADRKQSSLHAVEAEAVEEAKKAKAKKAKKTKKAKD